MPERLATPDPVDAARVRWSVALLLLVVAVAAGLQAHGRASRRLAGTAAAAPGGRWGAIPDAGAALRAWEAAGVSGRRLVLLTGRWPRPRSVEERPGGKSVAPKAGEAPDPDNAVYLACVRGVVRTLDVVMPVPAYAQRRQRAQDRKEFVADEAAFSERFEGLERRFSTPRGFRAPAERVLVLVEPSYFAADVPRDVDAWLAAQGATFDLALVALDDPAADDAQRAAARELADRAAARLAGAR